MNKECSGKQWEKAFCSRHRVLAQQRKASRTVLTCEWRWKIESPFSSNLPPENVQRAECYFPVRCLAIECVFLAVRRKDDLFGSAKLRTCCLFCGVCRLALPNLVLDLKLAGLTLLNFA